MTLKKGFFLKISRLEFRYIFDLLVKSVFEKNQEPSIYVPSKMDYLDLITDSRRNLVNDQDQFKDKYKGSAFPKRFNFICAGTVVLNWTTYLKFSIYETGQREMKIGWTGAIFPYARFDVKTWWISSLWFCFHFQQNL